MKIRGKVANATKKDQSRVHNYEKLLQVLQHEYLTVQNLY